MNNKNIAIQTNEGLESFKQGVNDLLSKRSYFISQVMPKLKENQDFYIIKGKKSLAKGGAEKLASIYNLTAIFERDNNALEMLSEVKNLVAFICILTKNNVVVGQGRGADTLERNSNDANKTLKMAQKRAYIDAVIRTTGLSDIFTQDIEDMNLEEIGEVGNSGQQSYLPEKRLCIENPTEENMITEKQKDFLIDLIYQRNVDDEEVRERELAMVDGMSKYDASELIGKLLPA